MTPLMFMIALVLSALDFEPSVLIVIGGIIWSMIWDAAFFATRHPRR